MNGLTAPAAHTDPEGEEIAADGWFPPIKLDDMRTQVRLGDGAVTTERLVAAIEGAMITALRALAVWRSLHAAAGIASLDAFPDMPQVNGRSTGAILWERIIRNYAAAELADLHRDISATDDGLDRAEEKERTAEDYRRLAYAAEADMRSLGAAEPVARNLVALV